MERSRPFGMDDDEVDIELPVIPKSNAGPPPDLPILWRSHVLN